MSRDPFGGVRPRSLGKALAIIERLWATIAEQQERITALEARIVEQRVEITALRAQVAALTERLE